jgi:transcriptional regulator with XRE-family HTH domain
MDQSTLELQLNLGESLALARKAEDLTQGELAEESGLSRATVANIESGGADPKISTIAELARALNMSPAWLLMSEEDMEIMGEIATSEDVSRFQRMLPDDLVSQISAMIRSGGKKKLEMALNSLRVAFQSGGEESESGNDDDSGLKVRSAAKMAAKASSGLTAVGTKLSPGIGTAIGAAWSKFRSDSSDEGSSDRDS